MSHNSIRPWRSIDRRKSRKIHVGNVEVGGDAPISVQTMTNTLTHDVKATVNQIKACTDAGADLVRVSCPDVESTAALSEIVKASEAPIIADIHFHYQRAIEAAKAGASCLRIEHIKILQDHDFSEFKISVKASDVFLAVAAYHGIADATDAPIHLGITEAGGLTSGTIKSSIGLGALLWAGIGDTLRVSLSADPVEEVKVGYEILKSLGLRHRGVNIISCPSCSRQGFDVISTVAELEKRLEHIRTPMSLSIIGCVVNGPGEALMTDVGFTGGGAGHGMVYLAGKQDHKSSNEGMIDHIVDLVEKKAAQIDAEALAETLETAV